MGIELELLKKEIETAGLRLGLRGRQILMDAASRLGRLEALADPKGFQVYQVQHPEYGPLPIEDPRIGLQISLILADLENRATVAEDALQGVLHAKELQEVEILGDKFHVPSAVADWIKQTQNRMALKFSLRALGMMGGFKIIPNKYLPADTMIVAEATYERLKDAGVAHPDSTGDVLNGGDGSSKP